MATILITGANRGLGLALATSFAAEEWRVIATCRAPQRADDLQTLAATRPAVEIHRLDVTDDGAIAALSVQLAGTPLDILFNNAGIYGPPHQDFNATDPAGWLETLRINSIAPLRMAAAFVEQVAASERRIIASMGSIMGSLGENSSGGYYAYRSSKAALHMIMRGLAADLAPRGITAVTFHPGWVRTRMGGESAPLAVEESAAGLTRQLLRLTPAANGRFLDWLGQERPW